MDCSPPGSSVHGTFQERILEQVAISCSKRSAQPRGLNPHLLHWQADSLPLSHGGSPMPVILCRATLSPHLAHSFPCRAPKSLLSAHGCIPPLLMCPRKITLEMLRYQPYQKRCGHKEPLSRGQHTCYIKKRWKAQYGKPNILQLKINKFNLIKTFSFP